MAHSTITTLMLLFIIGHRTNRPTEMPRPVLLCSNGCFYSVITLRIHIGSYSPQTTN